MGRGKLTEVMRTAARKRRVPAAAVGTSLGLRSSLKAYFKRHSVVRDSARAQLLES